MPFAGAIKTESLIICSKQIEWQPLTCTSVKTEVGPRDLDLGAAFLDDPTLRWGTIAIISTTGVESRHKEENKYIPTFAQVFRWRKLHLGRPDICSGSC